MSEYKPTLAIFIDILGTKDRNDFASKKLIHNIFHSEIKAVEDREKSTMSKRRLKRKVFSFSDCAYILYQFKEEKEEYDLNDLDAVFNGMLNTFIPIKSIMSAGFFIRGGIAFGNGYYDELGCFGPAIEKAYALENFEYPTINIQPEKAEIIYKSQQHMVEQHPLPFHRFVIKDQDRYYANIISNENYYTVSESASLNLKKASDAKKNIADTPDNKEQIDKLDKIIKKMEWLISLTEKEKKYWEEGSSIDKISRIIDNISATNKEMERTPPVLTDEDIKSFFTM